LRRPIWIFLMLATLALTSACTSYNADGELVRHHFGYVTVVSPSVHAPDEVVQVMEIDTLGIWLDRMKTQDGSVSGFATGFGYREDHRELIGKDCRIIFRAKNKQQISDFLKIVKQEEMTRGNICAVRGR